MRNERQGGQKSVDEGRRYVLEEFHPNSQPDQNHLGTPPTGEQTIDTRKNGETLIKNEKEQKKIILYLRGQARMPDCRLFSDTLPVT